MKRILIMGVLFVLVPVLSLAQDTIQSFGILRVQNEVEFYEAKIEARNILIFSAFVHVLGAQAFIDNSESFYGVKSSYIFNGIGFGIDLVAFKIYLRARKKYQKTKKTLAFVQL